MSYVILLTFLLFLEHTENTVRSENEIRLLLFCSWIFIPFLHVEWVDKVC